jgi:cardiolipin synthase
VTVANLITTLRIILAPIFIIYLINDQFLSALIVFLLCGISDGLDGFVARVFNQKSTIGSFLDPLADKIILVAAFIVLGVRGFLPPWLAVMVIARDVLILLGVLMLYLMGANFVFKPSIVSKITTCLQFVIPIAVLSQDYLSLPSESYIYLYLLTAAFTISSGLHYMYYWFKVMGDRVGEQ